MSTWFVRERQRWIAETLHVFGYINRAHIARKFGVSIQQASIDLALFQRERPDAVAYDKSAKLYRATIMEARHVETKT